MLPFWLKWRPNFKLSAEAALTRAMTPTAVRMERQTPLDVRIRFCFFFIELLLFLVCGCFTIDKRADVRKCSQQTIFAPNHPASLKDVFCRRLCGWGWWLGAENFYFFRRDFKSGVSE